MLSTDLFVKLQERLQEREAHKKSAIHVKHARQCVHKRKDKLAMRLGTQSCPM